MATKTIHNRLKKLRQTVKPEPKRPWVTIVEDGGVFMLGGTDKKPILTPEQVAEYRRTCHVLLLRFVDRDMDLTGRAHE